MLIKETVKNIISESVAAAQKDGKIPELPLPEIKIEYPREDKFGDYSTPFALETAKIIKKSPFDTGNLLKEYIEINPIIESVEVVKPGFINIFISKVFLSEITADIIENGDNYGQSSRLEPENINLEFVSANPTGPLNVVSARAAALGDSIANLLETSGHKVDREFYINDFGNQVRLLGLSAWIRYRELKGENPPFPEDGYHGEYIKDIAEHIKNNFSAQVEMLSDEDSIIDFFSRKAIEYNVNGQKEVMKKFNIQYKTWYNERNLHESGKVEKTYEQLLQKSVIYEEEGKKIFRSTDYNDDKDRVIIRDDGRPTYLLADIAYHVDKYERGYNRVIDIWGPDHHGYIARLSGAIEALGHKKKSFTVLIAQQVNLIMGGELVKMSKRLGNFSTMQELIDEIGVDAARFFFVMRSMDSHLDFDIELAKRASSENPVFYLQYAHARICSIFREAAERKIHFKKSEFNHSLIDDSIVNGLLKLLSIFPDEIRDSADQLEVHHIASYLLRLAQTFHKFYAEHRILSDDAERTNSLLVVCFCVKIVIKNGLKILGVNAPEKM
ncbi:MAG: arginine--tRNA ligase [Spirochaetes bacterium]|nr:arginine--tRNA ligase [Spirochaetota bacterium]